MRIKEEVRLSFIPGRYKPYLLILPPNPLKGDLHIREVSDSQLLAG